MKSWKYVVKGILWMNNLTSMQLISDVMRVGIDFIYRFDSLVISFFSSLCFIHTELSRAVVSLNCASTNELCSKSAYCFHPLGLSQICCPPSLKLRRMVITISRTQNYSEYSRIHWTTANIFTEKRKEFIRMWPKNVLGNWEIIVTQKYSFATEKAGTVCQQGTHVNNRVSSRLA